MSFFTYYLLLFIFSLTGWLLSFYFLGVVSDKVKHNVWWIPYFCRMNEGSCSSLVSTKYGKILGQPNAFWGMIYYSWIIMLIFLTIFGIRIDYSFFLFSLISILLSIYLIFGLLKLRINCKICIATHCVNFLMFLLTINFNLTN